MIRHATPPTSGPLRRTYSANENAGDTTQIRGTMNPTQARTRSPVSSRVLWLAATLTVRLRRPCGARIATITSVAATTSAFAIHGFMRSARVSCRSARDPCRNLGGGPKRLEHDTVSLGQLEQCRCLFFGRVRVDFESQAYRHEPDRRVLRHSKRPAEIQIALRQDLRSSEIDADGSGDRPKRHAGTGDQGFQEHVAGARRGPVTTCCGMKSGFDQRLPGFDLARQT